MHRRFAEEALTIKDVEGREIAERPMRVDQATWTIERKREVTGERRGVAEL